MFIVEIAHVDGGEHFHLGIGTGDNLGVVFGQESSNLQVGKVVDGHIADYSGDGIIVVFLHKGALVKLGDGFTPLTGEHVAQHVIVAIEITNHVFGIEVGSTHLRT